MGGWGSGGRRRAWKNPERSTRFWLPVLACQSLQRRPGPAPPACLKPTAEPSQCRLADSRHRGSAHAPLQPHTPFKTQPVSLLPGSLGDFSKLGWSAPGISHSSFLVPFFFGRHLEKAPVSCFCSPRETGNFLRAEVGVMQDPWRGRGEGHWSSEFTTSQFWGSVPSSAPHYPRGLGYGTKHLCLSGGRGRWPPFASPSLPCPGCGRLRAYLWILRTDGFFSLTSLCGEGNRGASVVADLPEDTL